MTQEITIDNIIQILIAQHDELRELMVNMRKNIEGDSPNYEKIVEDQRMFTESLKKHIDLENNIFYPCFISGSKRKWASDETVKNKKLFIEEMKKIEIEVYDFLEKYSKASMVENNWSEYMKDLENIISILLVRVESEESGIFIEWDLLGDERCVDDKRE